MGELEATRLTVLVKKLQDQLVFKDKYNDQLRKLNSELEEDNRLLRSVVERRIQKHIRKPISEKTRKLLQDRVYKLAYDYSLKVKPWHQGKLITYIREELRIPEEQLQGETITRRLRELENLGNLEKHGPAIYFIPLEETEEEKSV